jgi:hypothetical protein
MEDHMNPIIVGTSPFNEDGAQFAWDSTSLKLAETCLRKYQYKMMDGWQPERKSAHLLFGGEYASALEGYHKAIAEGVDREQAIRDIVHEALINTWEYEYDENDDPIPGSGTPWNSEHNLKTRGNLIRSIVWYFEQFRDDPCTTIITSTGAAAVEHSFKLPVDNGIIFSGHLDRLVEYSHAIYVQDQKSTGTTISSRYFDSYSPDSQMSLYTFAGKAIFNVPVKGVMIDAVQVAVGFSRYERGFTFRSEDQLEEWYEVAMHTIGRAQQAARDNYFPMNPSSCGNFGGCEFRHICSRSPSC